MPKKNQLSAPKAVNVFGDDSDLGEDDGVNWVQKSLKVEGEKNRIKKQARINAERALAEDPTIYQYDEIYSEIHVDTEKKKEEKKKQEPKYIGKLLQNAEKRKRENEVRIERMVQKEREAEGDMFKDKEKFVTASYRKKLEENKKLEEEEKERDRLESIGDVTKQVNVDGFYRHFFNQTFEIGAKKEAPIKDIESKKESCDKGDAIEKVKSSKQNLDADDSSVNDSNSDDQENKKEALKIISKNRKGKQYRQRVAAASESESEEEKEKDNKSKETRLETEKDKSTEERSSTPENKRKDREEKEDKDQAENKKDLKNDSSKQKKDNEEKPKPRKVEKKTSIWVKRTVGPVFEAALQRYYARQATRVSGS